MQETKNNQLFGRFPLRNTPKVSKCLPPVLSTKSDRSCQTNEGIMLRGRGHTFWLLIPNPVCLYATQCRFYAAWQWSKNKHFHTDFPPELAQLLNNIVLFQILHNGDWHSGEIATWKCYARSISDSSAQSKNSRAPMELHASVQLEQNYKKKKHFKQNAFNFCIMPDR